MDILNQTHAMPFAQILHSLESSGWRCSATLVQLIRALHQLKHPVSLAELHHVPELRSRHRVTLYKLLLRLEERGVVRRLHLRAGGSVFQLITSAHMPDYLICTGCHSLYEIPAEPVLTTQLYETCRLNFGGWKVNHHELKFYGTCLECDHGRLEQAAPLLPEALLTKI